MIQALTASTFEIDDPAIAVKEILAKINPKKLKKNSLGILTCSTEFLEAGAVSRAMPFDVIGCTTAAGASAGIVGEMILNLMVLTSDEVFFSAGVSESLEYEQEAPIETALRKATLSFALLYGDIQMPEMCGYESTRLIRAMDTERAKNIPVIAMTANVFNEDVEQCIAAGMNDHVGKPIDFDILFQTLEHYLPLKS